MPPGLGAGNKPLSSNVCETMSTQQTDSMQHSPLRHPPFRFYWGSRVLTTIAYQIQTVAIGWQVYELTHSTLDLGLVGLAQFLPRILLVLLTGHVADQYDRRRIVGLCQFIEGLASALLALASLDGWITTPLIFSIAVVMGAVRSFEAPAMQALLPGLVPESWLPRALALSASAMQTAVIIGPALGGLIYVAGADYTYASSALAFLLASLMVILIRTERITPRKAPVSLDSLMAGISFIRQRPVILGAISLDLFAVLLGGATALLPVYAHDILATGPWGLGLLRSAPAIGALLMSFWLARYPIEKNLGRIMFIAVGIFGLMTMIFAVSTSFLLSLLALSIMGAADMISVVIRSSLIQLRTPDAMRGRVNAVNSVFIGTSNQLGEFESGVTASWFGTVPAVLLGGIGTLAVVFLWIRLFPPLYHVKNFSEHKEPAKNPSV